MQASSVRRTSSLQRVMNVLWLGVFAMYVQQLILHARGILTNRHSTASTSTASPAGLRHDKYVLLTTGTGNSRSTASEERLYHGSGACWMLNTYTTKSRPESACMGTRRLGTRKQDTGHGSLHSPELKLSHPGRPLSSKRQSKLQASNDASSNTNTSFQPTITPHVPPPVKLDPILASSSREGSHLTGFLL